MSSPARGLRLVAGCTLALAVAITGFVALLVAIVFLFRDPSQPLEPLTAAERDRSALVSLVAFLVVAPLTLMGVAVVLRWTFAGRRAPPRSRPNSTRRSSRHAERARDDHSPSTAAPPP